MRIEHYLNHAMDEITRRDVEQVSKRLRELGWEEVIRCRNCMHYETDELGDYCTLIDFEDGKSMANGFCAWGERKVN